MNTPKFKPDWTTPLIPAGLLFMGVMRFVDMMKSELWILFIANLVVGLFLTYAALFNLVNTMRRNQKDDQ